MAPSPAAGRPHVVIVGAGFAGLWAARALRNAHADITVVDRQNHHLFQPLLYQVATAALSPAHVAAPIRKVLSRQKNCRVVMAQVESIDAPARRVHLAGAAPLAFDYLIVATGVTHSYFGHDDWARHAPGLKDIDDALEIRRRFLLAFERAEVEPDSDRRRAELTFVIVGAGPTGVELAGAIAEISRTSIPRDFRRIDTRSTRVILVEAEDRILSSFPEALARRAQRDLEHLGVQVWTGRRVTAIDERGVAIGPERLESRNVFWAAGIRASSLASSLAESAGAQTDRAGRVLVDKDLSVPGHPRVFVAGDLASLTDPATGQPVPGVAPAAMQMGTHAARLIAREINAQRHDRPAPTRDTFRYLDKGMLATIGRGKAVGLVSGVRLTGWLAFQVWAFVHILFLIGFRSRFMVLAEWIWLYFFFDRGARLITRREGAQPQPAPVPPSPAPVGPSAR